MQVRSLEEKSDPAVFSRRGPWWDPSQDLVAVDFDVNDRFRPDDLDEMRDPIDRSAARLGQRDPFRPYPGDRPAPEARAEERMPGRDSSAGSR